MGVIKITHLFAEFFREKLKRVNARGWGGDKVEARRLRVVEESVNFWVAVASLQDRGGR